MLEEGDEMNDDRLLSIEELVESDGEKMRRRDVVEHARFAGELIVAVRDVVHTCAIVGVHSDDGVRVAWLHELGNLNERALVREGELKGNELQRPACDVEFVRPASVWCAFPFHCESILFSCLETRRGSFDDEA